MVMNAVVLINGSKLPIALPEAVLANTEGVTLFSAIWHRLSHIWQHLETKVEHLCVVVHGDYAKAVRKAYQLFAAYVRHVRHKTPILLYVPCMLHQLSLSVNYAFTYLDLMGPLFCGTNLLHKGAIFNTLLIQFEKYVGRAFTIIQML
eukprot:8457618-Karenia_brevis.AAC.1